MDFSTCRLVLPPEPVLRAYLDLIYKAFLILRSNSLRASDQAEFASDMGDAMHNVCELIAQYDEVWLNDETFRRLYLRPFDEKWTARRIGPSLEQLLEDFDEEYARSREREGGGT